MSLTQHAYEISVKDFGSGHRKTLTVKPQTHPDYPQPAFKVYKCVGDKIYLPRYYAIQHFGQPKQNHQLPHGVPQQSLEFHGTLRKYQEKDVEFIHNYLCTHFTGIACLYTGYGKTVCALKLVSMLCERTLIVCHKTQLLVQWQTEIQKFLPHARIGIIKGTQRDINDSFDITIAMIQTLANITEISPIYGLVILDEVHRVAAEHFSEILFKVNMRYMLGMSATPERKDGLTCVLKYHLGDIFIKRESDRENRTSEVRFIKWPGVYNHKHYSIRINNLCEDTQRTEFIVDQLRNVIDTCKDRKILVVTDRRSHVETLAEMLRVQGISVGIFMGAMKQAELDESLKSTIVCATFGVFSEGVSIEALNTLVLASPKADVTQVIGRIFRKTHVIPPLIIDIVDAGFYGLSFKRKKCYMAQLSSDTKYIYSSGDSGVPGVPDNNTEEEDYSIP